MLAPVRTVPPASEPVTLTEAKLHCGVDHDEHDDLIEGLISAATEHLDGYTGILGRALVTQTWRQDFGGFGSKLRLPVAPVASVSGVTYRDGENEQQTLSTSIYTLFVDAAGPFVALQPDQDWPGAYARPDAVSVTFVAGVAADDVPRPIKQSILLMVGHWYANREAVGPGDLKELPMAVDGLLRPYRRVGV